MRFKYELQTLLDVKKQFESNAKNELAKKLKKLEQEKQTLQNIYDMDATARSNFNKDVQGNLSVSDIRMFNNYLSALKVRIVNQHSNVEKATKEADNQRQTLVKFSKEKKILETLKDKRFDLYKKEQLKEEENVVAEIVSYRYISTK